jgi:hypothetical protein
MNPKPPLPANVCCLKCGRLVAFGFIEGPTAAENRHLVSCPAGMPCPRAMPCHYSFGAQVPGCAPCNIFLKGVKRKVHDDGQHVEGTADLPRNGPEVS